MDEVPLFLANLPNEEFFIDMVKYVGLIPPEYDDPHRAAAWAKFDY